MSEGAGEEAAPVDEEGVEEFWVFEAEDDFVVTVEGWAGEVVGTGDDELASDALPFGVDGHVFRVDGLVASEGDAGGFEDGGDFRGGFAGVDEDGDVQHNNSSRETHEEYVGKRKSMEPPHWRELG